MVGLSERERHRPLRLTHDNSKASLASRILLISDGKLLEKEKQGHIS